MNCDGGRKSHGFTLVRALLSSAFCILGTAPVLDLLGLDPQPAGEAGANGPARDGDGGGDDDGPKANGSAKPLLLTGAVAPSMMGPVGAAREAANELAALAGEVSEPDWRWGMKCVKCAGAF